MSCEANRSSQKQDDEHCDSAHCSSNLQPQLGDRGIDPGRLDTPSTSDRSGRPRADVRGMLPARAQRQRPMCTEKPEPGAAIATAADNVKSQRPGTGLPTHHRMLLLMMRISFHIAPNAARASSSIDGTDWTGCRDFPLGMTAVSVGYCCGNC